MDVSERADQRPLAADPEGSATLLGRLAGVASSDELVDDRWDVALRVAGNPATPDPVRASLAGSPWRSVRAAVAGRVEDPATLQRLLDGRDPLVLFALAGNRHLPPAMFAALTSWDAEAAAGEQRWTLGRALANPALPVELLARVADLEGLAPWLVERIARHPSRPAGAVRVARLQLHRGTYGRGDPAFDPRFAEHNPDDRREPLDAFYGRATTAAPQPWRHPIWQVRQRGIHRRIALPPGEERQLARDAEAGVRRAAVDVLPLGDADLHTLADDDDSLVRLAARRRLDGPIADD